MSIFTNKQAFISVLFVFQLLNYSDETSTLLGGGHSTFTGGGDAPFAPPPAGYGPEGKYGDEWYTVLCSLLFIRGSLDIYRMYSNILFVIIKYVSSLYNINIPVHN